MPGFTALLQLDVAGLETFADEWVKVHTKLVEARTGFHDDVVTPLHKDHWRGEGGSAAQKYCDRIQMDIDALDKEVRALRKFLDTEADGDTGRGGVEGLAGLKLRAESLQEEALREGMTISDSGRVDWEVMYDPNYPESDRMLDERRATADSLETRVRKLLDDAVEDDEWLAKSLKVIFGTVGNFESENRKFGIVEPTAKDRQVHNQLNNVAAYFATIKGWPTAAGLVKHYLDGTGKPVEVEPQQMMDEIPAFREDVDDTLTNDVRKRRDGPFTTDWSSTAPRPEDGDSSMEWYYALNHFQYRLVGEKEDGEITYHVEVKKRYDWGIPSEHRATVSGGGPGPLGMELEQADIAHLHTSGMARDFNVSGSSDEMTARS
ncbi:hypothetical protein QIS99_00480 [Streptomyces sp. B-S-A8]|uniref:WXG100 family type VII secretion target n=1 Tax=Streptomyces solicavernae TaxID=3043614 RepID=A0ABT6RJU8_9ACTN|nr:hypothetical protein [Streptomyces sp. B-S-A8]MDI3384702.1 hypothetical protein [Streptomyces sp. B-S-A8]